MGQDQSTEDDGLRSTEELSQELALKFAAKCYTQLELYCFKEVFRSLADSESGLRYWTEGTLCRFLELPDALSAGPVVFNMVSNLGAFPFMSQAPCILTMDALLRVITLLTTRYKKVLKRGHKDRLRLLFNALAVFDRRVSEPIPEEPGHLDEQAVEEQALVDSIKGFDIDQPANDDYDDDDDDEFALAALDSLDAIQAIGLGERHNIRQSLIPTDNFLRLVELLLVIAPLDAQESLAHYADQLSDQNLKSIRRKAKAILWSFGIEAHPGVTYRAFKTVVPNSLPYLFDGAGPLFEHFLFQKNFDLSKRKSSRNSSTLDTPQSPTSPSRIISSPPLGSPTLPSPAAKEPELHSPRPLIEKQGEILTIPTITQLSFFLPPPSLFGRLYPLYSGVENGFSMGSFENCVFSWKAPSLLLLSGTLLPTEPSNSRERTFADSLPPRRYDNSSGNNTPNTPGTEDSPDRVTYGAYMPVPWKHTNRACLGDENIVLFQLEPVHDVFRASEISRNHLSYVNSSPGAIHPGINFGTPLPSKAEHAPELVPLGPVSLYLDSDFEYGVFNHTAAGGGSFHPSVSPTRSSRTNRASATSNSITEHRRRQSGMGGGGGVAGASDHAGDWQDRFEIDSVEVWGFGGKEEAERRKRNMDFEEEDARRRRESIAGRGGGEFETEREILRMAGLIGHGHEGGSIQ